MVHPISKLSFWISESISIYKANKHFYILVHSTTTFNHHFCQFGKNNVYQAWLFMNNICITKIILTDFSSSLLFPVFLGHICHRGCDEAMRNESKILLQRRLEYLWFCHSCLISTRAGFAKCFWSICVTIFSIGKLSFKHHAWLRWKFTKIEIYRVFPIITFPHIKPFLE